MVDAATKAEVAKIGVLKTKAGPRYGSFNRLVSTAINVSFLSAGPIPKIPGSFFA